MYRPHQIISGGQAGCDYGALLGAKSLGIDTGGWMPKGFRTENGCRPYSVVHMLNLWEHESADYKPRTLENVRAADATLLITRIGAPERGTSLTAQYCRDEDREFHRVEIPHTHGIQLYDLRCAQAWLQKTAPVILNVAGNRESISPGIEDWTQKFIRLLFTGF